jgi:hypothetical protein
LPPAGVAQSVARIAGLGPHAVPCGVVSFYRRADRRFRDRALMGQHHCPIPVNIQFSTPLTSSRPARASDPCEDGPVPETNLWRAPFGRNGIAQSRSYACRIPVRK